MFQQMVFNGNAIPGATNQSYGLDHVLFSDAGSYFLTVSNTFGKIVTSNASLGVLGPTNCVSAANGLLSLWKWESDTSDRAGTNNGAIIGISNYVNGVVG